MTSLTRQLRALGTIPVPSGPREAVWQLIRESIPTQPAPAANPQAGAGDPSFRSTAKYKESAS